MWPVMRLACSPCHYTDIRSNYSAKCLSAAHNNIGNSSSTGVEWLVVYQLQCNGPGKRAVMRLLRCWAAFAVPHMIPHRHSTPALNECAYVVVCST